jgi:hypothetical protein
MIFHLIHKVAQVVHHQRRQMLQDIDLDVITVMIYLGFEMVIGVV